MPQKPFKRRFNYISNSSNKFWEVEVVDRVVITRWGRIGSAGQAMTETLLDNASAIRKATEKAAEKLKKGYKEDVSNLSNAAPGSLVPLSEERLSSDKIAREALQLFQQNNSQRVVIKPRRKLKPKPSALPESSTKSAETKEIGGMLAKPKRRVRI
jgi:predicted DNA-binding WGR domain protein